METQIVVQSNQCEFVDELQSLCIQPQVVQQEPQFVQQQSQFVQQQSQFVQQQPQFIQQQPQFIQQQPQFIQQQPQFVQQQPQFIQQQSQFIQQQFVQQQFIQQQPQIVQQQLQITFVMPNEKTPFVSGFDRLLSKKSICVKQKPPLVEAITGCSLANEYYIHTASEDGEEKGK